VKYKKDNGRFKQWDNLKYEGESSSAERGRLDKVLDLNHA
jgi:hypothetical protein